MNGMREESESAPQNDLICVCTTILLSREKLQDSVVCQQHRMLLLISVKFTRFHNLG